MSKSMYCPHCGAYVGDCGHVAGGFAGPSTLASTCGKCGREYSVTCDGDCLKQAPEKQGRFTVNLRFSKDGRTIVDDAGKVVATFSEGYVVHGAGRARELRMPGHMECTKECIAWDSNGTCVRYVQSCTWVFPPL